MSDEQYPPGEVASYSYCTDEPKKGRKSFFSPGQILAPSLTARQYGLLKETHVDADPNMVMSLIGSDGDLLDLLPGIITRINTPGVYQDLVTRNGGGAHGCPVCSYDALGNVLSSTDARGFTTIFDRNELGAVYRTTSPAPYNYKAEMYYDANRNVVRVDTEDQQVAYESGDPTDPFYAQFMPSGNGLHAAARAPNASSIGERDLASGYHNAAVTRRAVEAGATLWAAPQKGKLAIGMLRAMLLWAAYAAQIAFVCLVLSSYMTDIGSTWRNGTASEGIHSGVVWTSGHMLCYKSRGSLAPWLPGGFSVAPARGIGHYWPSVLGARVTFIGFRYGSGFWGDTHITIIDAPLWIPCSITAVPIFVLGFGTARRSRLLRRHQRRASAGLCVRCGYNLKGNQSGACPECGRLTVSGSEFAISL